MPSNAHVVVDQRVSVLRAMVAGEGHVVVDVPVVDRAERHLKGAQPEVIRAI